MISLNCPKRNCLVLQYISDTVSNVSNEVEIPNSVDLYQEQHDLGLHCLPCFFVSQNSETLWVDSMMHSEFHIIQKLCIQAATEKFAVVVSLSF